MLSVSLNKTFLSISPGGDDPRGNVVDRPGPTPVPADRGHPGTVRVRDLGGVHRYLQESRQVNRLVAIHWMFVTVVNCGWLFFSTVQRRQHLLEV